jgi:hypothetical protein
VSDQLEPSRIANSEGTVGENCDLDVTNLDQEDTTKRKLGSDKDLRIREKNKQKRNRGEKYLGFSKTKNGKMKLNVE